MLVVGLAVSISLAEISLVALAVAVLAGRRRVGAPPLAAPLLVPVAAFAGWTLVAALASARPLESVVNAKSLLSLGAFYVVLHALPDASAARRFAGALFAAVAVVGALAVAQVALCPGAEPAPGILHTFLRKCGRARGFYSIYMTLAGVLTVVLVSALPRLARFGTDTRWLLPAWLVGAAALGLTYVRGAWIGFAVGAVGTLVALRRRMLLLAGVVGVTLALALALPGVGNRLATIGDLRDDTTRDRLAMIAAGVRLVREHPVLGVGPGQVKHLYPTYAPPEALRRNTSHLHNSPLQLAVERGLPGLAAWLAIFAVFFARARGILARLPAEAATDRMLVQGAIGAIATFMVAGVFEYNFGDTEVLLVAAALMALPFVVERGLPGARRA